MATLDVMAKRYGIAPHQLLDLDFVDLIFDMRAMEAGIQLEVELAKRG